MRFAERIGGSVVRARSPKTDRARSATANALSDYMYRGPSSGHRSNEHSHRYCGSCKSWPILRLRFCSHCFVVV